MSISNEPDVTTTQKTCGTCSICCKIVAVAELNKPAHQWCVHNVPRKGCGIWGKHPDACKVWQCGWILMPHLDERWKPEKCGFIIRTRFQIQQLVIDVEPSKPNAWRQEPFFSEIHRWARNAPATGQQIVVCIGRRQIVIFPEEDIDVGELPVGEEAAQAYETTGELIRPVVLIRAPQGEILRRVPGTYRLKAAR